MSRPLPTRPLAVAALLAALSLGRTAFAVDSHAEAAARTALKKAAADYRAKRYATAEGRLKRALTACQGDRCAPGTRASLLCDLGAVRFRLKDTDSASNSFAEAIAIDPDVALEAPYDKGDVRAAWDEAKSRAAGPPSKEGDGATANPTDAAPTEPSTEASEAPAPVASEEAAPRPTTVPPAYAHVWLGVAGAMDLAVLPSGVDLCKLTPHALPANSFNAYCTNPDGSDFPSRGTAAQNDALVAGQSGTVHGGLQIGDVRALLAVDYALSPSFLIGARVGYVLNTYPGAAAVTNRRAFGSPLHAEVRVTYLFGDAPLAHVGFSPMAFVGGGVSEFDAHVGSTVALNTFVGQPRVNIWITDGPFFAAIGGGFRYQFSLRAAFAGALRVNAAFAGNGVLPTFGPEIGFQYGF